MRTSYNFEEYRDSVAETLRKKKDQEGLTAASEMLAQEKLDIRYEISHELRRLERLLSDKGMAPEQRVEQAPLPENWERIDIVDKMPDWLKLLVDTQRVQSLGTELEEKKLGTRIFDKHLAGKIAAIYFPDEMLARIKEELLSRYTDSHSITQEQFEKECVEMLDGAQHDFVGYFSMHPDKQLHCLFPQASETIRAHEYKDDIFSKKVIDFINDVSGGLYLHSEEGEVPRPECLVGGDIRVGVVRAYMHSVGAWGGKPTEKDTVNHTLGNPSETFHINTPIRWKQVWVASPEWGYLYHAVDKPLVFFTLDNPAFRRLTGLRESDKYLPAVSEGVLSFEFNAKYQSALNDGLISTMEPTWADLSDTVVDLVKGEVLKHRYPEEKNPGENSE